MLIQKTQQINFTGSVDWDGNTTVCFCYWKSERNHFRFFIDINWHTLRKDFARFFMNINWHKLHKAFASGSSTNVKFSKTQLSKIIQLGGYIFEISIFGNFLSGLAKKEQM